MTGTAVGASGVAYETLNVAVSPAVPTGVVSASHAPAASSSPGARPIVATP